MNAKLSCQMKKACIFLISLPKTIWFNIKYLPLHQAIKLPILLHWRSRVFGNGKIILNRYSFGCVKLGFTDPDFPSKLFVLCITGSLEFKGGGSIASGCELVIRGRLTIGDNFSCSGLTKIDAKSISSFGDDVLIGHCCIFIDDDGHTIIKDGEIINASKGYHIGNHVWFGRECLILKGTTTADNIVFGARSIVSGNITEENTIVVGAPAKIVKRNISWSH